MAEVYNQIAAAAAAAENVNYVVRGRKMTLSKENRGLKRQDFIPNVA